ncbi:MAG: metal ABC transporter solute-binding protein, Zn/Mn family [Acidimicrobiales bacterium]
MLASAACASGATTPSASAPVPPARFSAVAAEDMWGNLLRQLGGDRVVVSSIIRNPGVDPHDYDPRPSDSVAVADARLVVVNGLGYDGWASKLVGANPSSGRVVVDVGRVVGANGGDNPHRWYVPADVHRVVDEMTAALERVDPADTAYFADQAARLGASLGAYDDQVARIRSAYAGTAIAISESVFVGMADALGLAVRTPPSFSDAISEGNEPTARDKEIVDRQIAEHQVKVFVYNAQNTTPDVRALTDAATKAGIPVVEVTETLSPRGATFQDWQQRQLSALEQALAAAVGPGPAGGSGR